MNIKLHVCANRFGTETASEQTNRSPTMRTTLAYEILRISKCNASSS